MANFVCNHTLDIGVDGSGTCPQREIGKICRSHRHECLIGQNYFRRLDRVDSFDRWGWKKPSR